MRHFKDLPIKQKLLLIIMSISLFTVVLTFMGHMIYDREMFRQEAKLELARMADVIGYNCVASLVFDYPADARVTLATLKGHKSIVAGWVLTKNGDIHARYTREDIRKPMAPPELQTGDAVFEGGHLVCSTPILFEGVLIGSVCLQSNLSAMHSILEKHFSIALILLFVSLFLAFLLSSGLQRLITDPIVKLGDLTKSISKEKDYSKRGSKQGNDEVGSLIDSFNEMLEQIQMQNASLALSKKEAEASSEEALRFASNTAQANLKLGDEIKIRREIEAELKKHREQLEETIRESTAELRNTNIQLESEIIERKSAEKKIQASLDEKSVLLSEIHHRVRNNLQIISSLLDMTRRRSLSDEARGILAKARSRIFAMALIHSQLYESEKFNRIDMDRHLQSLLVNIHQIYGSLKKRISPVIECSDVYLSLAQATPCALVFNEAISNVYKHAYKEDESGPCYISMKRSEDNRVFARVRDEGVGIPESVNADKIETLGLKLLRNLVLHQLKGKFRIERNGGTDLFFEFDIIHDDELIHSRH